MKSGKVLLHQVLFQKMGYESLFLHQNQNAFGFACSKLVDSVEVIYQDLSNPGCWAITNP